MRDSGVEHVGGVPTQVPAAAWAIGWSFLAGQLVQLARVGLQPESAWPLSVLLGVVLVSYFSWGVLRARMVRWWIVTVLTGLAALFELMAVLDSGDPTGAVAALLSATQLASLIWLSRTRWFAWHRTRPDGGPSLAPVMMLAVLVGVLAGMIGAADEGYHVNVTP